MLDIRISWRDYSIRCRAAGDMFVVSCESVSGLNAGPLGYVTKLAGGIERTQGIRYMFAGCSLLVVIQTMGRKTGQLFINPKKFGGLAKPCMKEMVSFLNCLSLNRMSDEKCVQHRELLSACMDAQSTKNKKLGSVNYHLQRLNRGRK